MLLLRKVIGVILGVLLMGIGVGFVLPSQVHVERAAVVDAPADEIFALVSDFRAWQAWSPWAQLDPETAMTIEGTGLGQTMTWVSDNPRVGQGYQQVTELEAPRYLKTHLDFGADGMADAAFKLVPEQGQTRVIWSLDTDMRQGMPLLKQPISTYVGFFMDRIIGKDYETGLQRLKQLAEDS